MKLKHHHFKNLINAASVLTGERNTPKCSESLVNILVICSEYIVSTTNGAINKEPELDESDIDAKIDD